MSDDGPASGTWQYRPTPVGRLVTVAALSLWLIIWAAGEAFVVGALLATVGNATGLGRSVTPFPGEPLPALLLGTLLALWLALWTLGGVLTAREVLDLLTGYDEVSVDGDGVLLRRSFLGRVREQRLAWTQLTWVEDDGQSLQVGTDRGPEHVTRWGRRAERAPLAAALRAGLPTVSAGAVVPPPPVLSGHLVVHRPEGAVLVQNPRSRTIRLVGAAGGTLLLALFPVLSGSHRPFDLMDLVITVGFGGLTVVCAVLVARAALAAPEWRAVPGAVQLHRASRTGHRLVHDGRSLELVDQRDSEGDLIHRLVSVDVAGRRRTVHSTQHDPGACPALGTWLATLSGVPLTDKRHPS